MFTGKGGGGDASSTWQHQTPPYCHFISDRNYKILSCYTPSLQLGYGTVWLLVFAFPNCHFSSYRNDKILSCSIPSLQLGFGTVWLLVFTFLKKHHKDIHFTCNEEMVLRADWRILHQEVQKTCSALEMCQNRGILCRKMRHRNTVHIVSYILFCFILIPCLDVKTQIQRHYFPKPLHTFTIGLTLPWYSAIIQSLFPSEYNVQSSS